MPRNDIPELIAYYRERAGRLRRKAANTQQSTARSWLIEAANECELRAIRLEADLQREAFEMATEAFTPGHHGRAEGLDLV